MIRVTMMTAPQSPSNVSVTETYDQSDN